MIGSLATMTFLAALTLSQFSFAGILSNSDPGKSFEGVQTYNKVQTSVKGQPEELKLIGAEVRTKKIVVHFNVYVGEYFKNDQTQAMRLSFLRSVDAAKIMGAFNDSLKINNVDTKSSTISSFLKAVEKGGEAKEKSTMVIVGFAKDASTDSVVFEDGKGQVTQIDGPTGFAANIFSIWLGKPSDDGLTKLQKAIKK